MTMKKICLFAWVVLCGTCLLFSCQNYETYSDLKEAEHDAINRFISDSSIVVISQATFEKNGCKTDLAKNEYVLLDKSGVYMQIVREGCGTTIADGSSVDVLCRFVEYNIKLDSLIIRNDIGVSIYNSSLGTYVDVTQYVDKMSVTREGSSYTASFVGGLMASKHSSASVPAGWLVPLPYVKVGRPQTEDEQVAMVKLIVPHSQGTVDASASVYPCYYELTYELDV